MIGLADVLRINALQFPHDLAVVDGDRRRTHPELHAEVNRLCSALQARGLEQGGRVAALAQNSLELLTLYFAVARLGAALVPLNFWHRASELRYVLEDAEPALLMHDEEYEAILADVDHRTPLGQVILPRGATDGGSWATLLDGATSEDPPDVDVSPEDVHMIMYTSGTTGRPKGAMLSQGRTVQGSLNTAAHLGIRRNDIWLNYFPSFHSGNWDVMMMFQRMGAGIVLTPQFDAETVLAEIEREGVTMLVAVPTMLHQLLAAPSFSERDLTSLRLLVFAGYDPSDIVARTADALGVREGRVEMVQSYGQTEAGPFVSMSAPDQLFERWRTVGRPVPGVEVVLRDDQGEEVPRGQAGEICVRGPMMSGYLHLPEETARAIVDGWLYTGDIGVFDEDGYLWMVDRKKDLIRSGGHNVFSKEIEDCLSQHEDVENVAVVGVPDEVWEEAVCAVVVPRDGVVPGEELTTRLQSYVRERLAGYNVPRHVRYVDALPRNSMGKVVKSEVRDLMAEEFGRFDRAAAAPRSTADA